MENKKIMFSGIQPTGQITIGNYIGSVKNWVAMQHDYNPIFCIVDMHAITVRQDPAALRRQSLQLLSLYLAAGIDPDYSTIFIQSHVSAHAELAWVLGCNTMFGELSRMTQFKDKSAKHADNINAGLFTYPVLMASDILLYQTDLVPVGLDQKQHVELARDIAIRFNGVYGDTFKIPEVYFGKVGKKIKSLTEPDKKMSKSDFSGGSVCVTDDRDTIIRKFKRAVTDSGSEIVCRDDKPGITNLITIYSAFTGATVEEIEREFDGRGYGEFKLAVGEAVADKLAPIQAEYNRYLADKDYLNKVLQNGSERAAYMARKTLSKVYRKVGFYRP